MTLSAQNGIQRQILDTTQALYYALEDAADKLHECARECGDCDGDGVQLDGGVCQACAPTREAERRARASQGLVPKLEQLGEQAEEAHQRGVAAVSHESGLLRAERDLALKVCLALRGRYYPYGPPSEGSGRIYTMACHAINKIERGAIEPSARSEGAVTELPRRAKKSREDAGLISQADTHGRLVSGPGTNTPAAHPGACGSGPTPMERALVGLEAPPLMEALDRLNLEIIHFRSRGRGIQFLINSLLEALEQSRGVAVRQASAEVSRAEMIERLRDCRDSLMRPGGEPVYSPAEIAVAIDAAIGELPAEVASPTRTMDLVRELELAVNEMEAFGLATEAQAHRRWVQLVRDALCEAGPACLSAQLSGTLGTDDALLDGESEGLADASL